MDKKTAGVIYAGPQRRFAGMVRFNGSAYDFRPNITLRELAEAYYKDVPKVAFEEYVVIKNSVPVASSQAEGLILQDNDNVFLVPIINGG